MLHVPDGGSNFSPRRWHIWPEVVVALSFSTPGRGAYSSSPDTPPSRRGLDLHVRVNYNQVRVDNS